MVQQSIRGSRRLCRLAILSFLMLISGNIDTVDGRVNLQLLEIQSAYGGFRV